MVDYTKPVRTVDGKQVGRVICTDGDVIPKKPIGVLLRKVGPLHPLVCTESLVWFRRDTMQLENIPEALPTLWANFYRNATGVLHYGGMLFESKAAADNSGNAARPYNTRIACIEVKGNVGDGMPPAPPAVDEDEEE